MATQQAKPVKLRTVAEAAGVSIATVSMALANHPSVKDDTKRRIRELSRQLGYRRDPNGPGRRPSRHRATATLRFGYALLGSSLEDDIHGGMAHSLTAQAASRGARLELMAVEDASSPSRLVEETLAFARGLQGLILSGYVDRTLLQELETAGMPHVVLGHAMADLRELGSRFGQVVASDAVAMGELAVRTLLAMGHRRIGFVCERLPKGLWAARWLRGYQMAHQEAGIAPDPALVHIAGHLFISGGPAADALLRLPAPPTAFVIPDVRVTASLREACRHRGFALPLEALVTSGPRSLLPRYGIEGIPWIGYEVEQLCAAAVRQLQQLCVEPMASASELLVAFATHDLPVPAAGVARGA